MGIFEFPLLSSIVICRVDKPKISVYIWGLNRHESLGDRFFYSRYQKLWQIFAMKQKCHTTAAFLDNPNFSIWTNLGYV